ncbi:hypothetical protein B0H12DRAFT_202194 [Mycena haematopus]|nr:hypothetical protein B0H12DRAFT_202194 [Mycena haematopus]
MHLEELRHSRLQLPLVSGHCVAAPEQRCPAVRVVRQQRGQQLCDPHRQPSGGPHVFSFNLGCATLKSSTLLKRLNNGEDPNTVAGQEIPRFNKAGGKVLAGLTSRRAAEVALFQTASQVQAHPC